MLYVYHVYYFVCIYTLLYVYHIYYFVCIKSLCVLCLYTAALRLFFTPVLPSSWLCDIIMDLASLGTRNFPARLPLQWQYMALNINIY